MSRAEAVATGESTLETLLRGIPPGARVEIVVTGAELLRGDRTDRNGPFLLDAVRRRGLRPIGLRIVGDEARTIARAVADAARRSDLVLVSGGLGATGDDTTRRALARFAGRRLRVHVGKARSNLARVRRRGRAAGPPSIRARAARLQASIPARASAIENPVGLALGFAFRRGKAIVVALPGVPAELREMVERSILPRLRGRSIGGPAEADLRVFGLSEVEIERRIRAAIRAVRGTEDATISIGLYPSADGVTARVTAPSHDGFESLVRACRVALGRSRFGEGETTLPQAVAAGLLARGATVALAESCTGGLVAAMLATVPGVSASLLEGWIVYSDAAKRRRLGVPPSTLRRHGAVSAETARAMARGARARSGADFAVAVTGIAGPTGATAGKPVGLVFLAVADPSGVRVERRVFTGPRVHVQRAAAATALDLLRGALLRRPAFVRPRGDR